MASLLPRASGGGVTRSVTEGGLFVSPQASNPRSSSSPPLSHPPPRAGEGRVGVSSSPLSSPTPRAPPQTQREGGIPIFHTPPTSLQRRVPVMCRRLIAEPATPDVFHPLPSPTGEARGEGSHPSPSLSLTHSTSSSPHFVIFAFPLSLQPSLRPQRSLPPLRTPASLPHKHNPLSLSNHPHTKRRIP